MENENQETSAQRLIETYSTIATLKLLPRTGWLQRGIPLPESVAEHSYGVAVLALLVGDTIGGCDRGRLLAIALLHDMAEALVTDLPTSARHLIGADIKQAAEQKAIQTLLAGLPGSAEQLALWEEYTVGASREARLVKALDRIEMLVQALAYERAGNRNLAEFWQGAEAGWDEFPLLAECAALLLAERP